MTSVRYTKSEYDDDYFMEVPHKDPLTNHELYFKIGDSEIYPKIYHKHEPNTWHQYCVAKEDGRRYYAKDKNNLEYYPKNSLDNRYIIRDKDQNPVFLSHEPYSFRHIEDVEFPNTNFSMFKTTSDLSIGRYYIDVMTKASEAEYLQWKQAGLDEERFFEVLDNKFRNFDTFAEKTGERFVFVKGEKHYVDEYSFVDKTMNLPYELDVYGNKLYFQMNRDNDRIYFIIDGRTKHFVIATASKDKFYTYKTEDGQIKIFLHPSVDEPLFMVDFMVFGQEIDDYGNLVCFNRKVLKKDYFWLERERLIYFEYHDNNDKKKKHRYQINASGKKTFFEFDSNGSIVIIKNKSPTSSLFYIGMLLLFFSISIAIVVIIYFVVFKNPTAATMNTNNNLNSLWA